LQEREHRQAGGAEGEERADTPPPLLSGEPDAGLDPGTLGSCPEPRADAGPTEPSRSPIPEHFQHWNVP